MVFTAIASAASLVASTTVPVWLSNRKTRNEVTAQVAGVHDEVRTNNGKSAGDYLEMVGHIADSQEAMFWLLAELESRDHSQFEATMRELALIKDRNTLRDAEHELWRKHFEGPHEEE